MNLLELDGRSSPDEHLHRRALKPQGIGGFQGQVSRGRREGSRGQTHPRRLGMQNSRGGIHFIEFIIMSTLYNIGSGLFFELCFQ